MSRAADFIGELVRYKFENVFNPYNDVCSAHDSSASPKVRQQNLLRVLQGVEDEVDTIWIGRDFGYRGGRRTGLALTDELHLPLYAHCFKVEGLQKATRSPVMAERTATEVWKLLRRIPRQPFLWNVFPFHPFEAESPMSNRCHSAAEYRACTTILQNLLGWLKPKRVIAIGLDAQHSLRDMRVKFIGVRHPSYGGQVEFATAISQVYGLDPTN